MTSSTARLLSDEPRLPAGVIPEGTKGRILLAALELFARHGFHGTSMRDLAREAGLQVGALYVHYPSKEHLLAELALRGHEAHLRELQRAVVGAGGDPVGQVRALVAAHARFHAEHAMLALLVNEDLHALSPELAGPALALRSQGLSLLQDVVDRGVAQGQFHPPNAFVTLAAIGGMGMRVAHWYRNDFELTPAQIGEVHAELAVRMLERNVNDTH